MRQPAHNEMAVFLSLGDAALIQMALKSLVKHGDIPAYRRDQAEEIRQVMKSFIASTRTDGRGKAKL